MSLGRATAVERAWLGSLAFIKPGHHPLHLKDFEFIIVSCFDITITNLDLAYSEYLLCLWCILNGLSADRREWRITNARAVRG